MKRIGIFAGSFDPIHDGHLELARSAVEFLELHELCFLIEQKPWSDKKPIDIDHRKNMVKLAIKKHKSLSLLDIENARFDIQTTLPELEKRFVDDELYFVFGADVFINMDSNSWDGLDRILEHYIVVFERKNITQAEITEHAKRLGIVVAIIPSAHPHHSSADVRMRPHEKNVWVPKEVADYIDKNGLY